MNRRRGSFAGTQGDDDHNEWMEGWQDYLLIQLPLQTHDDDQRGSFYPSTVVI